MPKQVSPPRPIRATHRLLLIFAITILAPGLILGSFGLRALMQERRLADQQIREKLAALAESTGRRLELELRDWQQAVDQLARAGPTNRALWPERVRLIVSEPGAGVVLMGGREHLQVLPAGRLLYELPPLSPIRDSARSKPPSALMIQAESLELRGKNYAQAITLYRRLLGSARSGEGAGILHALARTLKKAGETEEAARTLRRLEKEPQIRIGSLPSDLLALYEISSLEQEPERAQDALRLYRGLVEGRWRLEKSSYAFYSQQSREWIPQNEEARLLAVEEEKKLALSLAAERFIEKPQPLFVDGGSFYAAFWRPEPFAAILLGESFVRARLLPAVDGTDFQFSLLAPSGHVLVGGSAAGRE
ncbi:MAG: hypothetical protein HY646_07785, partial [Acidobacteria bacterium]|nr:hypothetical protein [Acidobacteriota bacterium]